MKILTTGATGLVGTQIIDVIGKDFEFIPLSSKDIDITNQKNVSEILSKNEFDILLHLAAYTNVDGAEKEKETAYKINVKGTKNIFEEVEKQNKKMILISTDFVFDGKNPPYYEDSQENPPGYYGKTKFEAEKIVRNKAMIVRISYPYRKGFFNKGMKKNTIETKPDFIQKIKLLLESKKSLKMIDNSLIAPTAIEDIAFGLKYLMKNYKPEIYHLVGSESYSPFEIGNMISEKFRFPKSLISKISFEEFYGENPIRPQYSEIKSKKNDFYKMSGFFEKLI